MRTSTKHRSLGIALVAILSMLGALFVLPGTASASPVRQDIVGNSIDLGSVASLDLSTCTSNSGMDPGYVEYEDTTGEGVLICEDAQAVGDFNASVSLDCGIVVTFPPLKISIECDITLSIAALSGSCTMDGLEAELDEIATDTYHASGVDVPDPSLGDCTNFLTWLAVQAVTSMEDADITLELS